MDTIATMTATAHRDAFGTLLQRHSGIVFKIANSYARGADDRADLAQEIAAQLWHAWPKYDPARSFSTWMYRVALNVAISHVREQALRRRHDAVPLDDELHDIAGTDRTTIGRRDDAAVTMAQRWLAALRKAGLLDTILQKELF